MVGVEGREGGGAGDGTHFWDNGKGGVAMGQPSDCTNDAKQQTKRIGPDSKLATEFLLLCFSLDDYTIGAMAWGQGVEPIAGDNYSLQHCETPVLLGDWETAAQHIAFVAGLLTAPQTGLRGLAILACT